jgi:hypothetical protein
VHVHDSKVLDLSPIHVIAEKCRRED